MFWFDSLLTSSGLHPSGELVPLACVYNHFMWQRLCLLTARIHPVKLTFQSDCVKYLQSNRTASQQMGPQRWAMRQFDLFPTGLLENQPAASPPLQGENKPNLLQWAAVGLFEKVCEWVSARKLLINRNVYSLETLHLKHLWVTAVFVSGCGWIITWEKTLHERRAGGDECRWASSCLSGAGAQWIINSVVSSA